MLTKTCYDGGLMIKDLLRELGQEKKRDGKRMWW